MVRADADSAEDETAQWALRVQWKSILAGRDFMETIYSTLFEQQAGKRHTAGPSL